MTYRSNAEVLIVDDDAGARAVLRDMVASLGFQVRTARNGSEALQTAQEDPPDAVLLDVLMPGLSGIEVCRQLRSDSRTAVAPILLVTGSADLDDRVAGFEAGADDYITKPFEVRELAARLCAHLELADARTRLAELRGALATIRLIIHEFNNPLQCVVGGLQMMKTAAADDAALAEEAGTMIEVGVEELSDISRRIVSITEPVFKDSPIGTMLDVDASGGAGRSTWNRQTPKSRPME
jgi:DNA-binding response OmpR family regulator